MKVTEKSANIKLEFSGIPEVVNFLRLLENVDQAKTTVEADELLANLLDKIKTVQSRRA